MINLRKYQENLKNKTREAFKTYHKVIMLAPCGAGKTVISSSIIYDSIQKNKIVWFVVHRQELLKQAEDTLHNFGIYSNNVSVHMIQTLANKIKKRKNNRSTRYDSF